MHRIALLLVVATTFTFPAQGQTADAEMERYFKAEDVVFVTARGENVEYLLGIPRVVGGDRACWDPEPPPGDPFSLRTDLNGDARVDAVEIGLRDSSVVVVACSTTEQEVQCHEDVVAANRSFRGRPRCSYENEELEGYNRFRLSEVNAEDRARWRDPSLSVFLLREGLGGRYYCVLPDRLEICGWDN